jgi:transketolase
MLTHEEVKELSLTANSIRQNIIKMLTEAGSGHSGGPLGMTDVFTALYFKAMKINPNYPEDPERDYLVLSNGHICPVLYATMAQRGYFPIEELMTLRKFGSRLQGHPHRTALPGLETTSGPLGSGLSQASGMALGLKMDGKNNRVFCCMSDGEHNEGNVWEAVLFAAKYKLNNLTVILDRNNIQIDGNTEDVMPLDPVKDKYKAFNWHVIEIDGHDFKQILEAIKRAENTEDRPTMIIANTTPGKDVSYMENRFEWHGNPPGLLDVKGAPPKEEQTKVALEELEKVRAKIAG